MCELRHGHRGLHKTGAAARLAAGKEGPEALETAAQLLHSRRHRAGTASSCGRCRADVEAVAPAFGWL